MIDDALDAAGAALAKRLNALLASIPDDPSYVKPREGLTDADACPVCEYDRVMGGTHRASEPCYQHIAATYRSRIA